MVKKNYKTRVSIIISIGIITLTIIYILMANNSNKFNYYHAKNGTIDLSNWNVNEDLNIALDGEWEFYPNVLLTPQDDWHQYESIRKYVQVPGSWESYLNADGSIDGSGTYRLRINLPSDGIYGIKSRTIRYSTRIFLGDQEVIRVGNPSTNISDYEPNSIYKIGFNDSANRQLDLIVQASSYGYTTGGIVDSIEFGRYESILNKDRLDRGIDAIRISFLLALGLFSIAIYFQRGKTKGILYFSVAVISIGIYISTLGEQLLNSIIDYNHTSRIQIQMATLMFVIPCLLRFVYHTFKEYTNKRLVNIITVLVLLSLSIAFLTVDGRVISIEFSQYFVLLTTLLSFLKIFYILMKAVVKKDESLGYIIVIMSSFFAVWIAMMLKILYEMDITYIGSIMVLIPILSASLLMVDRLQIDYRNVKTLSQKLIKEDELKDEFLARVSHELETPLHVIRKSSTSLIEGEKGVLNPDQQESLYFISQEGKRLSHLVSNLLDASQIKLGKININISRVDVYRLINNIIREMSTIISADKDIKLINQVAEDFPLILGDQARITQIIYNLIDNSIKFSEAGEIVISSKIKEGQAIFKVMDQGVGIKEEHQEAIFEKFYKETNSKNQGLGLGLPITKHLVELLGGEISIESNYGIGTNVTFSLPVYKGEQAMDEIGEEISLKMDSENHSKTIVNQDYDINRPTVLIVDDIKANHKVIAETLSKENYNLLFAEDGKTALEIVEKDKVDLIVLDYVLPDMSSNDICRKIREKFSMTDLAIIVLTASGRTIDLEELFASGVNDYIRKTADKEELISRIKSLLSMKESVKEGLNKEFQYFYSQISPHFLYNTINTIIGLSYKDAEKSRKALTNLAIYFRGKLEIYKEECLIPLEAELELVTAYLEIEQMRYGDKLRVEMNIDEGVDAMIPPLTIQPLVENAVHHGLKPKGKGTIRIEAKSQEGLVIIKVEDDGLGMDTEKQKELLSGRSDRLGFKNVMEKIRIIRGASLQLHSKEMEGTIIIIKIPEVKKYASNFSG